MSDDPTFKQDIYIKGDDGYYYHLSQEQWQAADNQVQPGSPDAEMLARKVAGGEVLGVIVDTGPEASLACYVLNLQSVNHPLVSKK